MVRDLQTFLCMIENQHLLQANVNIDPICTKNRMKKNFSPLVFFYLRIHFMSLRVQAFFYCVKYSKWMRRNWREIFKCLISKTIFYVFFFIFPFVSFLFHSITQFGFTHSETIKSSWFSLFFCYYPFFWFNTFVLNKIEYWQNIHEKKEHNNNNIMKYV